MEKKALLSKMIENYEEHSRILRKTEYEIYLGELKSKLNNLYFQKNIAEAVGGISNFMIFFPPIKGGHLIDRKISELEEEFIKVENSVKVNEDIQDIIFSIFKNYINESREFDLINEVDKTNTLITENTLQTLEKSINYQIEKIKNRIRKGRFYLAQMKDAQRTFDKTIKKLEDVENEKSIEIKKKNLEEIFDDTLNIIYEADLAIKDSTYLRITVYIGLLLTIIALIFALAQYFQ